MMMMTALELFFGLKHRVETGDRQHADFTNARPSINSTPPKKDMIVRPSIIRLPGTAVVQPDCQPVAA
jgi:hypothetical protein